MRTWLKNARIDKKLTMRDMGVKLGISESYYCAIENGRRQKNMDVSLMFGLSIILGLPVAEIAEFERNEIFLACGHEE